MKISDMICESCDFYEPWESEAPVVISSGPDHDYKGPWTIEIDGSCRRFPPKILPYPDAGGIIPGHPVFPVVSRNYWCGEGRWTDPKSGERYFWGDWDE